MRSFNRSNHNESADEGHYWISISDLMTSLLFIFILILAYTIFTFSQKSEAYEENFKNRQMLLEELQKELKQKHVDVDIDPQNGNMRIRSDTFFALGSADLSAEGYMKIGIIAKEVTSKMQEPNYKKAIDTIFIEGHTDNVPVDSYRGGRRWTNMELSAQRAINTFLAMNSSAGVGTLKNSTDRYLFSYSGYAEQRPIASNDSIAGRQQNRRIEFFFALSSPKVQ